MAEGPVLAATADSWARRTVLALTLVISCIVGLITPYLLAILCIALLLALALRRKLFASYENLAARLFLVAFLILTVCFALTARAPSDLLPSLNFIMLVLFAPLHALMLRDAAPGNAWRVADLALAGTIVSLVTAVAGIALFGWARAESPHYGAILLANTTVLLGFLSLIGVGAANPRCWVYGLAPLMAVAVVGLTGSRGPLVALVPLIIVSAVFIARRLDIRPVPAALLAVAYGGLCATVVVAMQSRAGSILSAIGEAIGNLFGYAVGSVPAPVADTTTSIRLDLYAAGYRAFLDAPWLGHGWSRLMSAPWPYLPADKTPFLNLPQLHNDVINFAVAAGVVGMAVYGLLLATPILSALRSGRDSQYSSRLFGCVILVTAYGFDGLTDLMFGFEFHTALYICLAAILLGYCRDPTQAPT